MNKQITELVSKLETRSPCDTTPGVNKQMYREARMLLQRLSVRHKRTYGVRLDGTTLIIWLV
jgi:hypothetical protein